MKTTKKLFLFFSIVTLISFLSCTKDFLEVEPKGSSLEGNFYKSQNDATVALVAVYDPLRKHSTGILSMLVALNAGSDDHFAGGGDSGDQSENLQPVSSYSQTALSVDDDLWSAPYQGIFRANKLLEKLPEISMPDNLKARYGAESKALRAYYYFDLVRIFRNIPLITVPVPTADYYNVPQANPTDVYAQIEKDLLEAIPFLPSTLSSTELGRFTKVAAQALLGKVYLYDNKKVEASAVLAEVNGIPGQANQYGNKLLTNFADLWLVSNKFNSESIFEIVHTNGSLAGWDNVNTSGTNEGNTFNQMVGPRAGSFKSNGVSDSPEDIAGGYGFNPITVDLYSAIKTDPRFGATVLDMKQISIDNNNIKYDESYNGNGYFINKFVPRIKDLTKLTGEKVLNFQQNMYVIRLSDTYLMEAEALGGTGARAQALLDAVRGRVGLPSVLVTLDVIKRERRMELVGEGHRFFDLVRWGDASTKLASRGFIAGKHEIYPIPYKELIGTKLVQNPGYN
jgi:starch-binding outer membrane protein, SusD/RagB family